MLSYSTCITAHGAALNFMNRLLHSSVDAVAHFLTAAGALLTHFSLTPRIGW
jgi:hypothetical protein